MKWWSLSEHLNLNNCWAKIFFLIIDSLGGLLIWRIVLCAGNENRALTCYGNSFQQHSSRSHGCSNMCKHCTSLAWSEWGSMWGRRPARSISVSTSCLWPFSSAWHVTSFNGPWSQFGVTTCAATVQYIDRIIDSKAEVELETLSHGTLCWFINCITTHVSLLWILLSCGHQFIWLQQR